MTSNRGPFVGLDYFDEDQAEFFFGRATECQRIIGNLRASRLTLLYAESGVGKSSLLRAGVAARLRSAELPYLPVLLNVWGGSPSERLIGAIEDAATGGANGDRPSIRRDSIEHALEDAARATSATPLVILDQFEEHFSYPGDGGDDFDEQLAQCINRRDLPANFLISIREDAYSGIGDRYKSRIPNVYGNYLHLDFLDVATAQTAVEGPRKAYNDALPDGTPPVTFGPGLVDTVVGQVRRDKFTIADETAPEAPTTGPERVATAYLQLVMERLWNELPDGAGEITVATLQRLGGAEEIVQAHLNGMMEGLTRDQLDVAATALRGLVTSSGRKIALSVDEIHGQTRLEPERLRPVLDHLVDRKILRAVAPARAGGRPRTELYHDVLAAPILRWQQAYSEERASREGFRRAVRIGVIAIAIVLVLAIIVVMAAKASINDERARTAAKQAKLASDRAHSLSLASLSARQLQNRPDLALLFAMEAFSSSPLPEARSSLMTAYSTAFTPGATAILGAHTDEVRAVDFNPNDHLLATASNDRTIRFWDADTHRQLGRPLHGHTDTVNRIVFSPDGRTLASTSDDDTVRFWDTRTRLQKGDPLRLEQRPLSVAFSPDGHVVAVGQFGRIQLFDTRTRKPIRRAFRGHTNWVRSVAFNANGKVLASVGFDRTLYLWDVSTGRIARSFRLKSSMNAAAWSHDNRYLAVATDDSLWLLKVPQFKWKGPFVGDTQVLSVAFSHDSKRVAAGAYKSIRLFSVRTHKQIGPVFTGHANWVNGLAISHDGRTLASVSSDQSVRLWDIDAHIAQTGVLTAAPGSTAAVAYSPGGEFLASGGSDGRIRLWSVRTEEELGEPLAGHDGAIEGLAFSPDGKTIVSAGVDKTVRVWDVADRKQRGPPLLEHRAIVKAVAFSPAGSFFASAGDDRKVRLWDARSLHPIGRPISGAGNFVNALAFSADGRTLAMGSGDKLVRLWDVRHATRPRPIGAPLKAYTAPVTAVALSPDGRWLAAGGTNRFIQVWDRRTRKPAGPPVVGHASGITSLAFAPDSQTLASASTDNTVRLWDVRTRQQLGPTLSGHIAAVRSIAFSPDGRQLASTGDDRSIVLSPAIFWSSPQDLRARVCNLVTTRLSDQEWAQYVGGAPRREGCP